MFTSEIDKWLNDNSSEGYKSHVKLHEPDTLRSLETLEVALNSELAYFYCHYGAATARGWYELNEVEQVKEWTDYAQEELGVSTEYLALTGVQGQGILLFNLLKQAIYDVEFGQFEQLDKWQIDSVICNFQWVSGVLQKAFGYEMTTSSRNLLPALRRPLRNWTTETQVATWCSDHPLQA